MKDELGVDASAEGAEFGQGAMRCHVEMFLSRKNTFTDTSLLHEAEQIVQELLPLRVTVQFIELHKKKHTNRPKKKG